MDINSRYPGSCNDPFIYRHSGLRDEMIRAYTESRCWLLGDSIYPEEPWIQVPLPHAAPGTPEFIYTRLHCPCRNAVERCIGVYKGRWRCTLNDRALHYDPVKAGIICNACAVLHNFCLLNNVPLLQEEENRGEDEDYEFDPEYDVDADHGADDFRNFDHVAVNDRRFLIEQAKLWYQQRNQ